jgi:hypothetical protein
MPTTPGRTTRSTARRAAEAASIGSPTRAAVVVQTRRHTRAAAAAAAALETTADSLEEEDSAGDDVAFGQWGHDWSVSGTSPAGGGGVVRPIAILPTPVALGLSEEEEVVQSMGRLRFLLLDIANDHWQFGAGPS